MEKNILLTIVLSIVNEGLSLTIVNETTNFIKTIVLEKKYMQRYWMSSYMKLKSCGGAKTSWYFLKNYSMISTDVLQVGFLSSLNIVNEGSTLTIVNETIFLKTTIFWKKRSFLKKLKTLTSLIECDNNYLFFWIETHCCSKTWWVPQNAVYSPLILMLKWNKWFRVRLH